MPPTVTSGMMSQPSPSSAHLACQQFRSALVLVAEAVVVTRHQMDGVIPLDQNLRDEILPGGSHHLLVKGDHDDIVDAVEIFGQPGPVLRGVDEGHRHAGDYLLGRLRPGEHRRADAPALGFLHRAAQQGAVAQMYPVKKAQSNDFWLNGHSLCSKKVLDRCQCAVLRHGTDREIHRFGRGPGRCRPAAPAR